MAPIYKPSALDRFRGQDYYEYETDHSLIFYLSRKTEHPVRPGLVHSYYKPGEAIRVMLLLYSGDKHRLTELSDGIDFGDGRHIEVPAERVSWEHGMFMFKNSKGAIVYVIRALRSERFGQSFRAEFKISDDILVRYSYRIKYESDHEIISGQVLSWFDSFSPQSGQSVNN